MPLIRHSARRGQINGLVLNCYTRVNSDTIRRANLANAIGLWYEIPKYAYRSGFLSGNWMDFSPSKRAAEKGGPAGRSGNCPVVKTMVTVLALNQGRARFWRLIFWRLNVRRWKTPLCFGGAVIRMYLAYREIILHKCMSRETVSCTALGKPPGPIGGYS